MSISNKSKYPIPNSVYSNLLLHQKATLEAMIFKENNPEIKSMSYMVIPSFYVLGDKQGTGKTLTVLSLLHTPPPIPRNTIPYVSDNGTSVNILIKKERVNVSLIIVPHGIAKQWENEIRHFYPDTKVLCIVRRTDIPYRLGDEKIIIVTNTMWKVFCEYHGKQYIWERIVYDEADTINIPNNDEVSSDFVWFVTSNPENIWTNFGVNYGFVRNLIFGVYRTANQLSSSRRILNNIVIKCSNNFLKESYDLPTTVYSEIRCTKNNKTYITEHLLTQTKHHLLKHDLRKVCEILDCQMLCFDTIVDQLTHRLRQLYANNAKPNASHHLNELTIRLHNTTQCPICFEQPTNKCITSCCNNSFCLECMIKHLNFSDKCPLCRKVIDSQSIIIESCDGTEINKNRNKSKLETLIDILISNKQSTIVFSDFRKTEILNKLRDNNIVTHQFKGNSIQINKILKNHSNCTLMLNSGNCIGYNLTFIDRIIIFHSISKDTESQLIGRCLRIGRDINHTLNIYKLIH